MNNDLQNKLFDNYPVIFSAKNEPVTVPVWSIETGDGWYHLIDTLCKGIQRYLRLQREYNSDFNISPVIATQVKEKFGQLRFYYTGGDSYVDGMVTIISHLSAKTCAECGIIGDMHRSYMVRSLCTICYEQKANEEE